jgi:predicted dehydrogenase
MRPRRALAAGKHVICEQLAGSLAGRRASRFLAERAGRRLMPIMRLRLGDGLRRLQRLIERGAAGRAYLATVETHWTRRPGSYADPWRGPRATELGGVLLSQAIDAHELLTFQLGPVRPRIATRVNAIESEDCAVATLEMAAGSLAGPSVALDSAEEISRLRFCFEGLTAESYDAPRPRSH